MTMISTTGFYSHQDNGAFPARAGIDLSKYNLEASPRTFTVSRSGMEKLKTQKNIRMVAIKKRIKSEYCHFDRLGSLTIIIVIRSLWSRQFCKELGLMLSFRQGNPRAAWRQRKFRCHTNAAISCDGYGKACRSILTGMYCNAARSDLEQYQTLFCLCHRYFPWLKKYGMAPPLKLQGINEDQRPHQHAHL